MATKLTGNIYIDIINTYLEYGSHWQNALYSNSTFNWEKKLKNIYISINKEFFPSFKWLLVRNQYSLTIETINVNYNAILASNYEKHPAMFFRKIHEKLPQIIVFKCPGKMDTKIGKRRYQSCQKTEFFVWKTRVFRGLKNSSKRTSFSREKLEKTSILNISFNSEYYYKMK